MRKENELEHGLYYVERNHADYHKISGSWSFEIMEEEKRILTQVLHAGSGVLARVQAKRDGCVSGELTRWEGYLTPNLEDMDFGLYYINTDASEMFDFFQTSDSIPALWGVELITAKTLVDYALREISKAAPKAVTSTLAVGSGSYITSTPSAFHLAIGSGY